MIALKRVVRVSFTEKVPFNHDLRQAAWESELCRFSGERVWGTEKSQSTGPPIPLSLREYVSMCVAGVLLVTVLVSFTGMSPSEFQKLP